MHNRLLNRREVGCTIDCRANELSRSHQNVDGKRAYRTQQTKEGTGVSSKQNSVSLDGDDNSNLDNLFIFIIVLQWVRNVHFHIEI